MTDPTFAYLVRPFSRNRSDAYEVTKWSSEKNEPEAIYEVQPHRNRCSCPVRRGSCKHIKLVKRFIKDRKLSAHDPLRMYEEADMK